MSYPTLAAPRHFSGKLTAITLDCCLGLHRMEVQLVDDDGGKHTVYFGYSRGDAAALYAKAQYDRLQVGARYFGSATVMRKTPGLTEWGGHVPPLEACRRGHRFSHAAQQVAA